MKVLALQLEKSSGCALMIDGEIRFASSEERYTRIKSDAIFPINAINDALKMFNLSGKDLDKVLICSKEVTLYASLVNLYSSLSVDDQLMMMKDYWEPKLVYNKKVSFLYFLQKHIQKKRFPFNTKFAQRFKFLKKNFKHKINQNDQKKPFQSAKDADNVSDFFKDIISHYLKVEKKNIEHVDHHTCHAYYAFYGSPIRKNKTLVVTADAFGDYLSGTISFYDSIKKKIKRVKSYFHMNFQLARIYRFVTIYLRMLGDSHEYKIMGLAPYYKGPRSNFVVKKLENLQKLNGLEFKFNKKVKNIFFYLEKNFFNFRFDHIATGLQDFTEKILVKWFRSIIKKYNCSIITYSGGQSMNVKANMEISKIKQVKDIFVCGSGTDDTLPLGACYFYAEKNNINPKSLNNMYLGSFANYENKDLNHFKKYKIIKVNNLKQVCDVLLKYSIISVCRGRAEMGQRSLGNRSILADPRFFGNVKKINTAIKQRDFWMPFAPVILDKYQKKLIINKKNLKSPFMTLTFDTTKFGQKSIPAAIHPADKTARAQILEREQNQDLWNLINIFYEKTGVPALLNTSFNLHGYPIVNSIWDAKKVLENSDLQVLWLDNHILIKK